jgi:hypothetical protein
MDSEHNGVVMNELSLPYAVYVLDPVLLSRYDTD